MTTFAFLIIIVAGLAGLFWLVNRERSALWRRRKALLADCRPLFERAEQVDGVAGFPRLAGEIAGRRVVVELLPDTMTLRRLPQLWLSLTVMTPLPDGAAFGALARPSGSEFYARTPDLPVRLEPPIGLPEDVMVRGRRRGAAFLAQAERAVADLMADARVKEVLVMPAGLRVIFQAAEGNRGQHLLLRQCDFGDERFDPALFMRLYDGLEEIARTLLPAAMLAQLPETRGQRA
ncbi:hypothetical protein AB4037_07545 [Labrys sp. KB_33_2]|uniref:hypothetical protein n=1 Tax=unclassified Labrys (in: a-proteobacteria) TaxID=2688601 RepID=UPI003EBD1596